jgi:hypothetical protein
MELQGKNAVTPMWVRFQRFGAGPSSNSLTAGTVFLELRGEPGDLALRERLSSSLPPLCAPEATQFLSIPRPAWVALPTGGHHA